MSNPFQQVRDFQEKYKQDVDKPLSNKLLEFRLSLIEEEYDELIEEVCNPFMRTINIKQIDKQNLTKELSDLIYVTIGMAVTFGLPLEEVFNRTHESNMSKNGGVRDDGKILKGGGYKAPVLEDLFK